MTSQVGANQLGNAGAGVVERRAERLGSAGLRAVAREPKAEVHGTRLEVDRRPMAIVVPYLALDAIAERHGTAPGRRRGVLDAIGLRLRHSDRALHLELSPEPPLERVIFDIAEQFRCEALADPLLLGVRSNTTAAFDDWSEAARSGGIAETGIGLLVYTATHLMRYRLLGIATSEMVDEVIESTRFALAKLVGHAMRELAPNVADQRAFADPAREIARLIAEMAGDGPDAVVQVSEAVTRNRLLIPVDWDTLEEELAGAESDLDTGPLAGSDYRVFSREHDVEKTGAKLYRESTRQRLRVELDAHVAAQSVSVARLAQRLQRVFPAVRLDGWSHGEDDGLLDPGRLSQIVVDPANPFVRRLPREVQTGDAVVSFLIDTSGSMKVQRFEAVAVLVDTFVRALEMAQIKSEVLGFTTASWGGGKPQNEWRSAGEESHPGRLAELQHIVYKSADQSWRQARLSIASMLKTDHYREGVDGEALEWAAGRLAQRTEARRALVMISDGVPMQTATANHNRDGFLGDHLRSVARAIETGRLGSVSGGGSPISLGAIGIDHDLAEFVANSVRLDLAGTLTIGTYDVLDALFAD